MGLFIVIESDTKALGQIQDVINSLDPQAVIKAYSNLPEFQKEAEKEKILDPVSLILIEFSNKKITEWPEALVQIRKLFVQEAAPEINNEIPILLSSFDEVGIPHSALVNLDIYNVLFKPFDLLILKENINAAMTFKKRLTSIEIKSMQTTASIGILKGVEMVSVSELGFVTLSDSELPKLTTSQYFSPIFSYGKKQSVWGQCVESAKHPEKPNCFINRFQYYGVDTGFLMAIRKYIVTNKLRKTNEVVFDLRVPKNEVRFKFGLLTSEVENATKLKNDLINHFKNIDVELIYFSQSDEISKKEALLSYDVVLNLSDVQTGTFVKLFKENTVHFWLKTKLENDEQRKELALVYKDLFYTPIDRSYLYKKLKIHLPDLAEKEISSLLTISCTEKMKSANLIKISNISEVSVDFNYNRELAPKTNREFIFIREDESNLVELQAFCHFVEPAQGEKGKFSHQFVFFGMTDHYLKQIRLWLTQDYIIQNKKEE